MIQPDVAHIEHLEYMTKDGVVVKTKIKAHVTVTLRHLYELLRQLHRCVLFDECGYNFVDTEEQFKVVEPLLEKIRDPSSDTYVTDRWQKTNYLPCQLMVLELMKTTPSFNAINDVIKKLQAEMGFFFPSGKPSTY